MEWDGRPKHIASVDRRQGGLWKTSIGAQRVGRLFAGAVIPGIMGRFGGSILVGLVDEYH